MIRKTAKTLLGSKDFDAWAYSINWPQCKKELPLLGVVNVTVEDIKFAYNAWSLLRLAMFFGLGHPKVMSNLPNTKPSMDISAGGNRLFYLNANVGEPLGERSLKIALTPDDPKATPIQTFPWQQALKDAVSNPKSAGIEIVLGMENGLSKSVIADCDHCVYIAQYGSIGSLSMMSALAVATHTAVSASPTSLLSCPHSSAEEDSVKRSREDVSACIPAKGHVPQSNHPDVPANPRPHETNLLRLSNEDIVEILRQRRMTYPLQIGILMYNELGDRNIGAVMRNANAFNCEEMIILNRRRFNRRGAVGTNHLLKTSFIPSSGEPEFRDKLDGYEVWLLYQYYPYLELNEDDGRDGKCGGQRETTFIRHDDPLLTQYLATHHFLTPGHPLGLANPSLVLTPPVSLDDEADLLLAVRRVKAAGKKGIMLAVPEEGTAGHPQLVAASHRVLYVVHPNKLAQKTQRGLNAALSTAVAMERIRTCIDSL